MRSALPLLAVAAVIGCGGATTAYTRTGPTLAAQPDGCDFAVVTAPPSEPHTELGTIDITYTSQMDWIHDESAFKRKVRPLVCQNGGDTAVAHTNNNGLYVKATVLTTKAIPSAEKAAPPPETAAAAVEAVAEPVSPPPAASPPPAEKTPPVVAKEEPAKKEETGKKGGKKGASAKKDDDIRGKDGKIDIDKLL
jgi:hypothetical protein